MFTTSAPTCSALLGLVLLVPGIATPAALAAQTTDGLTVAKAYREAHAPAILRDYADLLALPNVAADTADIERNAEYLQHRLSALGVRTELLRLAGASPIVYGRLDVPGATRTLALYAHYDGQPVNPKEWRHDPWTPTLYTALPDSGGVQRDFPQDGETVGPEWRVFARAAGDDKAPIGALLAVLAAFHEHRVQPSANIVFFFEGEEEAGSTHLGDYLRAYRDRLNDVDVWLFLDGPVHQSGRPLLAFGARGVTRLEITVYGPTHGLHSGHYGNWAPVPGRLLAQLLATMWDADGRVLVRGFYDDDAPIGDAERAALARLPNYDDVLRRELGLAHTEGEPETLAERLMLPALTVLGLRSANVGALATNVIPATAIATLGVRLVKGNDPEKMLDLIEAHIRREGYFIVREDPDLETRLAHPLIAKVQRDHGYPAARTDMNQPIVRDVIAAARRASGEDVVLMPGMGGSLPLYLFTDMLGKPAVVVPVANYDDNQHAPDENLRIGNLWYAIDLLGALLTMPPPAP
jgi:acetylornithine deacetylase/succinyl-diaminopimelate desuccinylase-like protein